MAKLTVTFRLPADFVVLAHEYARFYRYKNVSELYSLILTEKAYSEYDSKYQNCEKLRYSGTIPQACRVFPLVANIIYDRCAPAMGNTPSIWCCWHIIEWFKNKDRNNLKRFNEDKRGPWSNVGMPGRSKRHRELAADCLKDLIKGDFEANNATILLLNQRS